MFNFLQYLGGVFLGWSLGANDSANVFGTAVSSKMVKYRTAIWLTALFVILGALLQGEAGIETLSKDLQNKQPVKSAKVYPETAPTKKVSTGLRIAMISSFAAAMTVTIMTILKIPVSTSQAVVGAIIGVGLMRDNVNLNGLGKVVLCWIGTPVGGALFTFIFYWFFKKLFRKWNPTIFKYDPTIRILLILCGCYGAYALGANNVANVSAVFVGPGMLNTWQAAVFGAISIAAGALTYSKAVMLTVGKGIVALDSFTAFICVLSHAVTVHIYAIIGVPVSTSQAIVGAVLGIGIIKGAQTINFKTLRNVAAGWTATPFIAGIFSAIGYFISNLEYIG
jgi:PiT family inorganic phosphate transporter